MYLNLHASYKIKQLIILHFFLSQHLNVYIWRILQKLLEPTDERKMSNSVFHIIFQGYIYGHLWPNHKVNMPIFMHCTFWWLYFYLRGCTHLEGPEDDIHDPLRSQDIASHHGCILRGVKDAPFRNDGSHRLQTPLQNLHVHFLK